ncbi:putative FKBP-type peptidyl-prolyl cis-trans isomerase [Mannheimia haemolytica]
MKVHYKGTLTDGTVFDSSYDRGEPIEFQLNQLIPGWIEAIPMLKKGGKMEIVVPPALAYGDRAAGKIPANSTLKFEIELLDFKAADAKK